MTRGPDIGVVLSAGASSRMGRPKALLKSAGRTFLERIVRTLERGGCRAVVVVTGRHVAEIAPHLPDGALLVHNSAWERGQLSSAQVGLRAALAFEPCRVLLHLVDQPLIRPTDVSRLLAALARFDLAIASHHGEEGHPVALTSVVARRVVRGRGDSLREVLARMAPRRTVVEGCSAGCVRGANTPGELRALVRTVRDS